MQDGQLIVNNLSVTTGRTSLPMGKLSTSTPIKIDIEKNEKYNALVMLQDERQVEGEGRLV